jgi:simple sugar transport system ATP-binding protein
MVHQHFMLVDSYSVAENVVLGFEPKRYLLLDRKKAESTTAELAQQYGLSLDPRQVVRNLPVGIRQRVEILKVLNRGSNIIVLDEPTAVLTPQESQELFMTISSLVKNGKTIIFITHKLKEVMAVADRVTVMRRGQRVGLLKREEINEKTLSTLMVGREVMFQYQKDRAEPGEKILQIHDLKARGDRGNLAFQNVSFFCRRGEIVTIAGVEGNGQTELIEAITGLRRWIRPGFNRRERCAEHFSAKRTPGQPVPYPGRSPQNRFVHQRNPGRELDRRTAFDKTFLQRMDYVLGQDPRLQPTGNQRVRHPCG